MSLREKTPVLSQRTIFWLWLPLAGMWLIMAAEMPLVAAFIARLPQAKENLAAFGLTFSISMMVSCPVLQLLTTSTALASGRQAYNRLKTFMIVLGLGLTSIHLTIGLTPVYGFILERIIGVPSNLIEPSRVAFLYMTPWALALGFRRLWQGILIRSGSTLSLPITTVLRLLAISGTLVVGLIVPILPGASLEAAALNIGAIINAAAIYLFVRPIINKQYKIETPEDQSLSWRRLLRLFVPLALSTLIALIVRPIVSIGLSRASFPLESLAVFPVIMGFMFLFSSTTYSYQEAVVALHTGTDSFVALKRFALIISIAAGLLFFLIVISPLGDLWFARVAGLPSELLFFVRTPALILSLAPVAVGLNALYRGAQVTWNQTPVVTKAIGINCLSLILF